MHLRRIKVGVRQARSGDPGRLRQTRVGPIQGRYGDRDNSAELDRRLDGPAQGCQVRARWHDHHLLAKVEDLELDERSVVVQSAQASFDISLWQAIARCWPTWLRLPTAAG